MNAKQLKLFNSLPDEGKQAVLKRLELEHMKVATHKRLHTNPAIKKYFKQFSKNSVESFISLYVNHREFLLMQGDKHLELLQRQELKFRDEVMEGIKEILRKKLMMKMSEWVAGVVDLPGVETSDDFHYWQEDVLNCRFIDPVTPEEMDIYLRFVSSENYEEYKFDRINLPYTYFNVKRDYDQSADDNGQPEFSALYDTLKGTTAFWLLPNHKGTKEDRYRKLHRANFAKQYNKDVAAGKIKRPKPDHRPYLNILDIKQVDDFIKKFEPAHLLEKFRGSKQFLANETGTDEGDELQDEGRGAFYDLYSVTTRKIGVNQSDDYRKALIEARDKYFKKQHLEAYEPVYEDYLFRVNSGLEFERNEANIANAIRNVANGKNEIIQGRILAGEPADLDIYG